MDKPIYLISGEILQDDQWQTFAYHAFAETLIDATGQLPPADGLFVEEFGEFYDDYYDMVEKVSNRTIGCGEHRQPAIRHVSFSKIEG